MFYSGGRFGRFFWIVSFDAIGAILGSRWGQVGWHWSYVGACWVSSHVGGMLGSCWVLGSWPALGSCRNMWIEPTIRSRWGSDVVMLGSIAVRRVMVNLCWSLLGYFRVMLKLCWDDVGPRWGHVEVYSVHEILAWIGIMAGEGNIVWVVFCREHRPKGSSQKKGAQLDIFSPPQLHIEPAWFRILDTLTSHIYSLHLHASSHHILDCTLFTHLHFAHPNFTYPQFYLSPFLLCGSLIFFRVGRGLIDFLDCFFWSYWGDVGVYCGQVGSCWSYVFCGEHRAKGLGNPSSSRKHWSSARKLNFTFVMPSLLTSIRTPPGILPPTAYLDFAHLRFTHLRFTRTPFMYLRFARGASHIPTSHIFIPMSPFLLCGSLLGWC